MRQLSFLRPGQVDWESVPDPVLTGPDIALLRPLAVARCDLDIAMVSGIFPGPYPVGHEVVGEVVAVGEDVRTHRVGDRVLVPFQVSCGTCRQCTGLRFAACTTYRARAGAAFGFGEAGGGHGGAVADLLAVPAAEHLLLAAPGALSAAELCTLPDNVVDAYRTVGPHLAERPGADVLVLADFPGAIGLYAVACALALGAAGVRYVDSDPERRAAAETMGADVIAHDGDWPRRYDRAAITVDCTGSVDGLACCLRSTEDYGVCTGVAIQFTPTTPVPLLEMYTRGVTLLTSRADSRRYLPEVIDLAATGVLRPLDIPTTVVDWADAATAWLSPATKLVVARDE